jgi:hypothetical protein
VVRGPDPREFAGVVRGLAAAGPADARALAEQVENKHVEKHHGYLSDALLAADCASSRLDTRGALRALESALRAPAPDPGSPRNR